MGLEGKIGESGPRGFKGDRGRRGSKGHRGDIGMAGIKGDIGDAGVKGTGLFINDVTQRHETRHIKISKQNYSHVSVHHHL